MNRLRRRLPIERWDRVVGGLLLFAALAGVASLAVAVFAFLG